LESAQNDEIQRSLEYKNPIIGFTWHSSSPEITYIPDSLDRQVKVWGGVAVSA
jgi:hypothetical protein